MLTFVKKHTLLLIAVGLILGVLIGGLYPEQTTFLGVIGHIFLNALKLIVIPLIFVSVAVGIANLGDMARMGRLAKLTIGYYFLTTTISVILGLILVVTIRPGDGVAPPSDNYEPTAKTALDFVNSIIPSNFFKALVDVDAIPIILVAILFGVFLLQRKDRIPGARQFFIELNDGILGLVRWIMVFAPLGVLGLVAGLLGSKGGWSGIANALAGVGKYSLVVMIGLTIHSLIILPLILRFVGKRSVPTYVYNVSSALATAIATSSSSATLPETIRCAEENNKIRPTTAGFVLPLGATINMDGTALYEAVAAIFIAQSYGVELGFVPLIVIFLTATLASIGAAGIPQAGLVTMVLVLNAVGLPTEGIALILLVDWLLDRFRTVVNVWGDCVGTAVVDTWLEKITPTVKADDPAFE
ncbi:MAG: dicarboxylate/amino acid:cation symporter [Candidatus Zixiibacteriota bacterium]